MKPGRELTAPAAGGVVGRRAGLDALAALVGDGWAKQILDELRREGRSPIGGWPGTISEARARLSSFRGPEARALVPLDHEEREYVARGLYACARATWLANAQPDPDERPGRPTGEG
ncbi:MAG TPA: hypothetical protein VFS43_19485 [Polyangiaceae bacterium]|nr:hypothetical protein [Polyangiaceae bacterium]